MDEVFDYMWEVSDHAGKSHRFLAAHVTPNGPFLVFANSLTQIVHIFYAPLLVTPHNDITTLTREQ